MDKNQIIQDNNVFEDALGKFQQISEEELVSDGKLKKSKQAIIAGKLLRIRQEIKQLELQLKHSAISQQSSQDDNGELAALEALKQQLLLIYKSEGFKSIISRHEYAAQLSSDKQAATKQSLDIVKIVQQLK